MKIKIPNFITNASIGVCLAILSIASALDAGDRAEPVMVNVDNFVRAETAVQFEELAQPA